MMRKILTYIISLVALLGFAGCHAEVDDISYVGNDNYIKLHFAPYGDTRGTIADNECESYLSHLDVIIYKQLPDGVSYEGFYHERVSVSDTPDGVTTIHRTKEDFDDGVKYKIYVIANSNVEESVYYNSGNIISHSNFLKLDQTNNKIHLSGIDFGQSHSEYPQMFLMDGVAYMGSTEPAQGSSMVINDGTPEDVKLKVTLRRAAAKIIVTITPGDKVSFSPALIAKSQGYLLRNMPVRTTLVADGGYPLTEGDKRPYWTSPTISQSPYFQLLDDGNGGYKLQITAYCYSHTWKSSEIFHKGTSLVVMLPISYKEDDDSETIEYINNYYQISFSKKEEDSDDSSHLIKRNTLYDLRVTLNAPGAEDYTTPEEIKDLKYFTAPWETVNIPVSGEAGVQYLKVNKNKLIMYNNDEDLESLYFSSSSPVTVQLVSGSAHYFDKYNVKKTLSNTSAEVKSIKGIVDPVATSGSIGIQSANPTNNTIRYFQIEVKNEEGLTEIIDVEQYPLIYITNSLPWYSYRDDYYYRTNEGHSWDTNITTGMASGDLPTTYQSYGDHIVSISKINSVSTTNKTATYTYSWNYSGKNSSWTCSKVRGNAQSGGKYAINYYYFTYSRRTWSLKTASCETHNVRNYKVRVMASSKDYILARPNMDEYGYTAGDDNNAKLVSPSFVIASRLGAVLSTYSGLSGMSNDKKLVVFADHCKNYVEVDDVNDDKKAPVEVYDNWRLPTEAELNIIIGLQGGDGVEADAIDFLLNGQYYMSASGPVYNPKNTAGSQGATLPALSDPWKATDVAIRCVRDAYE